MAMPPNPPNLSVVSERPYTVSGGHWYLCTQCSAVMGASWANSAIIPATSAEAYRIYQLSGHSIPPGTTQAEMITELSKAYGHIPIQASGLSNALFALQNGAILTIAGDYSSLPTQQRRWDASFTGAHEMAFGPIAPGDSSDDPLVWLRDPLAPVGYSGEWVAWSVATKFAYSASYIRMFYKDSWETSMDFISASPTATCDVLAGGAAYKTCDINSATWPKPVALKSVPFLGYQTRSDGVKGAWVVLPAGLAWGVNITNIVPAPSSGAHTYTVTDDAGTVIAKF